MKLKAIIKQLDFYFPQKDAAAWDFVGWQVQSKNKELDVETVLVALDVSEAVIDEAITNDIKLIIAHHPFIFAESIAALKPNKWKKRLKQKLINHDINVFVLHTNFDVSSNGMNFLTAKALKLKNIRHFDSEKLSVTGAYQNLPLKKVIRMIKDYYQFDKIKVIASDLDFKINKVVVAAGAGGVIIEFLDQFIDLKKNVSLVITGEMKWHQEVEAREKNLNVLILGHEMEEKFVDFISEFLKAKVFIENDGKIKKYFCQKAKFI